MSSDDSTGPRRQVLGDVSEKPDIRGYSIVGLVVFFSPAATLLLFALSLRPAPIWIPLMLGAIVTAFAAIAVIGMTPSHVSTGAHAKNLIRHYTQQAILIHKRQ